MADENPIKWEDCEVWHRPKPDKYKITKRLILDAIEAEELHLVKKVNEWERDINGNPEYELDTLNVTLSKLKKDDVRTWLNSIGYPCDFFGTPDHNSNKINDIPPYLDPSNPNYSTELAAAVNAWVTVNDGFGNPSATFRQRIIEALEKSNPSFDFELNKEGKYTKEVDRIATICNPDTAKK
jgi:hypothetical protein